MEKKLIRQQKLNERRTLSNNDLIEKSLIIENKVINSDIFNDCKVVLLYSDYNNEVITRDIFCRALELGKIIAYPKSYIDNGVPCMDFYIVNSLDDLKYGYKGILEPSDNLKKLNDEQISNSLCIVPGVAFDNKRMRIGYGKGFYDRFLSKNTSVNTIALAFEFQIVESVDVDNHDLPVDLVITECRTI